MRVLVCIDDTDNLESIGTGKLAYKIINSIEERGWGRCEAISRHQLYVHDEIPYTSHNSSMCFGVDLDGAILERLINYAADFLIRESAAGSDPGLCVVVPGQLKEPAQLIEFGFKAKGAVLTKKEAYQLAGQLGVHLSEHGGTGGGVIGALAGAGLRLSGNDGRLRGRLKIGDKNVNDEVLVSEIKAQTSVHIVQSLEGQILHDRDLVRLGEKVKAVLMGGKVVMPVYPICANNCGARWQTCTKEQLKKF
ncbi:MAG: hypothetical protein PHY77_01600 [Desulfotomaculaceae bacterium]|nr:hypothetical protein [Desulfotomaculaceae bacterium]